MKRIKKYFKVWLVFGISSFQSQLNLRWTLVIFLIGKIFRFSMFTIFIVILLTKTEVFAGYNLNQTILFYLTFNLVDVISQLVFREVYRFRHAVVSGTFDFYLIKPYNPLFRALTSGPDLIDFITLIPLIAAIVYFISMIESITFVGIILYLLLIIAGLVIATAFHILVLSLAIVTTEIDSAILMYRDVVGMGRFPIDIYKEPIRGFMTFVIPVGIMMTFPVKALMGLLNTLNIIYALFFAGILFYISLIIWNASIKNYSSASS